MEQYLYDLTGNLELARAIANPGTNTLLISLCTFFFIILFAVTMVRQAKMREKSQALTRRVEFWLSEKNAISGSIAEDAERKKEEREQSFTERVLLPLSEQVGAWMAEKSDYADQKTKRLTLIKAGLRDKNALYVFYGIRLGISGALFFGFVAVFSVIVGFKGALTFAAIAAGLGYILPNFILENMASKRQNNIDRVLPDALDLLVICAEAGMSIDQSLMKVATNIGAQGKDLTEEIILTNREMALGQDRTTCWKNLGERTNSEELRSLASIVSQSEKRGGQVARILREQADFMRVRRRQKAEEKAAQLTVKMMIPMAIFIFPVIMCVTLGPPMLKLASSFSGG